MLLYKWLSKNFIMNSRNKNAYNTTTRFQHWWPFHGFHKEFQAISPTPSLGHEGFHDVTFVSHDAMGGCVALYECGVEVPVPAGRGPQARAPVSRDTVGEYPARSAPPDPHGFMADLEAPLVQQVFDVASRQRVADREHHRQADDLGAGLDVPEREGREISRGTAKAPSVSRGFVLTVLHFGHVPKSFTLSGAELRPYHLDFQMRNDSYPVL